MTETKTEKSYLETEIKEMAQKPVFVTMFRHHLFLPNLLNLDFLRKHDISVPQSIIEITHRQYLAIKGGGKLDERFTVS